LDNVNILEGLKYAKEHEWVRVEGNSVVVGITDFAQNSLTDVVFVELPEKGKKVEAGKSFCVVESVKSVSDVYAPVSGEITEVNQSLEKEPGKVNNDPYGSGWIARIEMSDKSELDKLLEAEGYMKYLAEEKH